LSGFSVTVLVTVIFFQLLLQLIYISVTVTVILNKFTSLQIRISNVSNQWWAQTFYFKFNFN